MYKNYGDVNFFEYGILIDTEHSDTVFQILACRPYDDEEDLYRYGHLEVDIEDTWIDKEKVMDYIGMDESTFDPIQYAIGIIEYYPWENFIINYYSYDWRGCTKDQIKKDLRNYLIASDNLNMEW
jgi:hypothetical protein